MSNFSSLTTKDRKTSVCVCHKSKSVCDDMNSTWKCTEKKKKKEKNLQSLIRTTVVHAFLRGGAVCVWLEQQHQLKLAAFHIEILRGHGQPGREIGLLTVLLGRRGNTTTWGVSQNIWLICVNLKFQASKNLRWNKIPTDWEKKKNPVEDKKWLDKYMLKPVKYTLLSPLYREELHWHVFDWFVKF